MSQQKLKSPASRNSLCELVSLIFLIAHYSVEEITNFYNSDEYKVISLTASDKYGDLGLVGASIINGNTIIAFMLSCRVFDRGFECVMMDTIKALHNIPLKGVYVENGKNSRFMDFYKDNGIETK